jgi:hypothetical protein
MLNYAYTVLEGQVRTELIRFGFDTTMSTLHAMREDRPALVLDVLEPCRTIADRAILRFVREQTFALADFKLNAEGVCRLHPQLARRVAGLVDVRDELDPQLLELAWRVGFRPNRRPTAKLDYKLDVRMRESAATRRGGRAGEGAWKRSTSGEPPSS